MRFILLGARLGSLISVEVGSLISVGRPGKTSCSSNIDSTIKSNINTLKNRIGSIPKDTAENNPIRSQEHGRDEQQHGQ